MKIKRLWLSWCLFWKEAKLGHLVVWYEEPIPRNYALKIIEWEKSKSLGG